VVGKIKISSNGDIYFADIIALYGDEIRRGEYFYDVGIAECYDLDENSKIDYIEIDYIEIESDDAVEYSISAEISDKYMDRGSNCLVIEFN
jgi:hypothetical protein